MKLAFLAENIKTKLEEQKISVSEFERSAGLKRCAVANILAGKSKNPTLEVVISIANRLGCSIEELLASAAPIERTTRSMNVTPQSLEEDKLFFEIGELLLKELLIQKIRPTFSNFINCYKEIFFYATHGHKNKIKDKEFLLWVIKSHFTDEPPK